MVFRVSYHKQGEEMDRKRHHRVKTGIRIVFLLSRIRGRFSDSDRNATKTPKVAGRQICLTCFNGWHFSANCEFFFPNCGAIFRALTLLRNKLRPGFEPLIELHFSIAIPSMRFFHGLINEG